MFHFFKTDIFMEDSKSPMCMTLLHINELYFKSGIRLVGEADLFLFRELPLKKLLELKDCPPEAFPRFMSDLLMKIGKSLAKRLLKDPYYKLVFQEEFERSGLFTKDEVCAMWAEVTFKRSVLQKWDEIPTSSKQAQQLILCMQDELAHPTDSQSVYLYAILVYVRTLAKQKLGESKWQTFRPFAD